MQWILFLVFVAVLLALDLGVFNRKDHVFTFKQAVGWSIVWVTISCIFGGFIWFQYGHDAGSQWFTAYVLEKSLSVDNLFVMSLIFTYFATPAQYQHRCLFWGILGAIILRGVFILTGVTIIHYFSWILYIFGAFLIYSAFKVMFSGEENSDIKENTVVKWFEKHFNIYPDYNGHKFINKEIDKDKVTRSFTLLFVVLLMIETTDILFAFDSVPAALCVSNDAFVLYTSNIMAILGLRALYFVLLSVIEKFWLLKYGIGIVLAFIGAKMLISHWVEISSNLSLIITLSLLTLSIILSTIFKQKEAVVAS